MDYRLGFAAVSVLSLLHVVLEFPLNFVSMKAIFAAVLPSASPRDTRAQRQIQPPPTTRSSLRNTEACPGVTALRRVQFHFGATLRQRRHRRRRAGMIVTNLRRDFDTGRRMLPRNPVAVLHRKLIAIQRRVISHDHAIVSASSSIT